MNGTRNEDGFTLPELLVSVVILGIISGAITGAIITGLNVTDGTSQRIKESTDAQLASAYFANDVQSSGTVVPAAHPACAPPAGGTAIVSFSWEDPSEPAVPRVATWFTSNVGEERHLSRRYCEAASGYTVTVSRALAGSGPDLACPGDCAGSPRRVALTVTETSGYTFRLAGTRRSETL